MTYQHCIFCAANEYKDAISAAMDTMKFLEDEWDVEHDVVLCAYHSVFNVNKSDYNTEIYLVNSDLRQLILDCMEWAVVREKSKSLTI